MANPLASPPMFGQPQEDFKLKTKQFRKPINLTPFAFMAVAAIAAVYMINQTTNTAPQATSSYQNYQLDEDIPDIYSAEDLQTQLQKLDSIDIDQLQPAMTNNEADAFSF